MAAEKGRAFLLKLGDGGGPEAFTTIAGMRSHQITINNEIVDITNKESAGWRELLAAAGVRAVAVSGSGVFTDSATEIAAQGKAMDGSLNNYEIVFESGDKFAGAFIMTSLEYAGEHNGERTSNLTLESSGVITFTAV